MRGSPLVLVMRPNELLVSLFCGSPKLVWLSTLKNSARN